MLKFAVWRRGRRDLIVLYQRGINSRGPSGATYIAALRAVRARKESPATLSISSRRRSKGLGLYVILCLLFRQLLVALIVSCVCTRML